MKLSKRNLPKMKLFKRIFLFSIIVMIGIFSTIYINILYHAGKDAPQKSDVIVVLGCQIRGESPSPLLGYRLQKALELYKAKYSENIIVSGGKGGDEVTFESRVMKAWLVSHGVDAKKIFEENKSTSTFENLKFSKDIMDRSNFKTAIIVSSDFHIFRSLKTAKRLDIQATGAPAPTVSRLKLYYHSREILAVIKSFLLNE